MQAFVDAPGRFLYVAGMNELATNRKALAELSSPPGFIVDPDLGFGEGRHAGLLELWRSRCVDGRLPARRGFDVLELRDFMGWLNIAEVLPGGDDLVYRLVGTGVVERMGRDITGRRVSEVLPPTALRIFRHLIRHPAPLRGHGAVGWRDREFLHHETLLLPLADDGATVDRFFILTVTGPAPPLR